MPRLAADAEALDQRLVASLVDTLDVIEKAAAGLNHLEQAAAGMVILAVALEVLGEVGDALGEDCNLHFRRTGIPGLGGIFGDERGLALSSNRHRAILSNRGVRRPRPGCRPGGALAAGDMRLSPLAAAYRA